MKKKTSVLDALEEMYRRANEWEKPYDEFPGKWTREASHIACPLIGKIMRLIEKSNRKRNPK